jgi:hypothetical protein
MFKIKSFLVKVAALALLLTPAMPVTVSAQGFNTGDCLDDGSSIGDCLNTGACVDGQNCDGEGAEDRVSSIVNTIINVFSLIVGIVSVIMIIVGGFQYITSGGDSGKVGNAKNTILYAIVGLVIVALAQVIVQFVLNRATV